MLNPTIILHSLIACPFYFTAILHTGPSLLPLPFHYCLLQQILNLPVHAAELVLSPGLEVSPKLRIDSQ